MSFLVATNVIASQPPECRLTGTLTVCANKDELRACTLRTTLPCAAFFHIVDYCFFMLRDDLHKKLKKQGHLA